MRKAFDAWWARVDRDGDLAQYTRQGQALQAFKAGWMAAKFGREAIDD